MDVITLQAGSREVGKRGARAVRRAENVPCILYGHHAEPVAFQVPEKSLNPLIYTHETHLVQVDLDGKSWRCIIKDIAFHPVSERPIHADFQVLQAGEMITLSVPMLYLGMPIGQTRGGRTIQVVNELEVSCLPKDIPSHIDIDISHLEIGDAIHVADLNLEGIEIHAPDDQILAMVQKPRAEIIDLEEEVEEEGDEEAIEEMGGDEE